MITSSGQNVEQQVSAGSCLVGHRAAGSHVTRRPRLQSEEGAPANPDRAYDHCKEAVRKKKEYEEKEEKEEEE